MSYDTYLRTTCCERTVRTVGDYTSNVSSIWAFGLGRELDSLEGMKCEEAAALLADAIRKLCAPEHRERLLAMQPDNGWGSLDGATEYLRKVHAACIEEPELKLHFWR